METVILEKEIKVYCITAESFPTGSLQAHKTLHQMIPYSEERRYFGISRPENGVIVYKAAAEALEKDKAEQFDCESFIIQKGRYRCLTVLNYKKDIGSIGKAFGELISYPDIDPNGYCIEWYYNNENVKCMVKVKGN